MDGPSQKMPAEQVSDDLPHETKDPEDQSYRFSGDILDSTDVHGLTIVSKPEPWSVVRSCRVMARHFLPITKVDTLDVKFRELLAARTTGHQDVKEGIFDITMSPVLSFNCTNGGFDKPVSAFLAGKEVSCLTDVPSSKRMNRGRVEDEYHGHR